MISGWTFRILTPRPVFLGVLEDTIFWNNECFRRMSGAGLDRPCLLVGLQCRGCAGSQSYWAGAPG